MQAHNILPTAASVFPTNNLEALTVKPPPIGLITAEPNPFQPDSEGLGQTTLSWRAHGTSKVEIHVNAPNGRLFATAGPGRHSQPTGRWLRDDTTFYLQNVSKGLSLVAENTIATVTLRSM